MEPNVVLNEFGLEEESADEEEMEVGEGGGEVRGGVVVIAKYG